MIVTRAVLPVMRKHRSVHIIAISSTAGLTSLEFCSASSASKFGLEGFMQALQSEVAPFGINTTIVTLVSLEQNYLPSSQQSMPTIL
jgi:short-subunit dehydrogenase